MIKPATTATDHSRKYAVKELFLTLQGEGAQAGRLAVFLRFAGCNLWSGLERDRAGAACTFCDTDFVGTDGPGGGRFADADALASAVAACWQAREIEGLSVEGCEATRADPLTGDASGVAPGDVSPYVICTGGEPLLQIDAPLLSALHASGFKVGVETNGTVPAPVGIDWLCVSPKGATPGAKGAKLAITGGDELKLVYPQDQPEAAPDNLRHLPFTHHFLQPRDVAGDPAATQRHVQACVLACARDPKWRLSVQTHKVIGLA
ncbi:MAG: 7-carboxy-7-deazaguanine synthase [Pseudomonadota bacterium]